MNHEPGSMQPPKELNRADEVTSSPEALPEEQFIAAWNTIVRESGGWPSANAEELKMLNAGLYLTADVRRSEPRVAATLRLVKLGHNNYQLYLNDCNWGSGYGEASEEDYRAAVDFVANIANRLCQIGIPIERIGFQGSYNDSARYQADMNSRFKELKGEPEATT